jgi:hypothetical protein
MKLTSLNLQNVCCISFLLLATLISIDTYSQPLDRIEFEQNNDYDYIVVPMSKSGFCIVSNSGAKVSNSEKEFLFDFYSTRLEKEKSVKIKINKNLTYKESRIENGFVYLLFGNASKNLGGNEYLLDYHVIKIDISSGTYTENKGIFTKAFYCSSFSVMNGDVILGGSLGPSVGNQRTTFCLSYLACFIPLIFHYDKYYPHMLVIEMNNKKPIAKEIPINNYEKGINKILSIDVDSNASAASVLLQIRNKKQTRFLIREYSGKKLGNESPIDIPNNKEIYSGKVYHAKNSTILTGTYGNPIKKLRKAENKSARATEGIFIRLHEEKQTKFIATIPFNKLPNKKEFGSYTDILFHKPHVYENEIVLIGELYYPFYRTEQVYNPSTKSYETKSYFEGYKFFGIQFWGIDMKGKLLWSNNIKFDGPLTLNRTTEKFNVTELSENIFSFTYNDGKTINSTIINKDNSPEKKKSINIEGDARIKNSSESKVEYWYDNYFICYGNQTGKVTDKKSNGKSKKRVFYIQKISLN